MLRILHIHKLLFSPDFHYRNCIGQHFAMNEIKVLLSRIVTRYDDITLVYVYCIPDKKEIGAKVWCVSYCVITHLSQPGGGGGGAKCLKGNWP